MIAVHTIAIPPIRKQEPTIQGCPSVYFAQR
jgi:hypothetical protein